jgi:hypothetical protein
MARAAIKKDEERVTILNATAPAELPEIDASELVSTNEVVGDATKRNKPVPKSEEVVVKRYRVTRVPASGMVLSNNNRCRMPIGKILDGRSYNLRELHNQGVGLEEVREEPQETSSLNLD